ncbi:MAG TPA: patatin-like phospholipase family protein, partial [Vicinamibacteria bacterium]|nr:patatin-like phospholipase family protein [Vicinamibacteria bacterium]
MKEYNPKRRTALVLTGSGSAGAYHAGVLRALDESGVKIDLLVGSGAGAVAAAFGAVAGGAQLYGPDGFWHEVRRNSFFRLRPSLKAALVLLGLSFFVFLLPVPLALLWALLLPLVFILDPMIPGAPFRALEGFFPAPGGLRETYLAVLAAPVFLLWVLLLGLGVRLLLRNRRRILEFFESPVDATRARERLRRKLWEVVRGANPSAEPPSEAELGQRYVSLSTENFGQPGFREVVFRAADLEKGDVLAFVLLQDGSREAYAKSRPS